MNLAYSPDRKLFISLFLIITSLVMLGCGQNNLLQGFSKPEEHANVIEEAQAALDNGQYDKAISLSNERLRRDPQDEDALAIKGQSLLGKAGGGLTDVLAKIGSNQDTTSNFNALSIIAGSKLDYLYQSADILRALHSGDQSVQLCEGVACMLTAVSKVTWTFDTTDGLLYDGRGTEPALGTDVSANWNAASNQFIIYSTSAVAAIAAATGHDDLRQTVSSVNADIVSINNFILSNPGLPLTYQMVLSTLGYL